MKYQNRIMALPMLCMIIIVLSACCFDEQKNETSNVNPKVQSVETVSVTRGNLTPTVSAHTTIIPALDFVLCSSVEGTFEACSSAGNKITEGGVIGKVSEEEIKSPVDATILSIISSNESVPKNYPLATAKYTGFALNIEAENFLKILPENAALKAKFQVVDGVGPTEAIAVVVPVSENAESTLQCLIGKDIGNAYDSVLAMLQLGLLVTSFLLLFVSVLGQINIGLSSLEQRTHELLIRRAIGASRANIVTLVLGTQLIISIFVCIASILLSLLIVEGISVLLPPDSPITAPSYPIFSAVIAVITSVIVALLGGLLPAIKAAKLEPALALR